MKTILVLTVVFAGGLVFAGVLMSGSHDAAVSATNARGVAESRLPAEVAPVLQRACRDCHSNQTIWPWYSKVPPMSLMVHHDVEAGRAKFNFSPWADGSKHPTANQIQEICDAVSDGSMPPKSYRLMHRDARLSRDDVDVLCGWATPVAEQLSASPGN